MFPACSQTFLKHCFSLFPPDMNTVIYRIGKVTLSQNVPVNITKKWISEIFHVRKLYVALYSPKRTEMGVLVVSGRRLNRLIGRIHSNQTFHKQAQSSSIRGTILQRTFYSQPQSDAYSQGTDGSKAPVAPPITSQLGQLFENKKHFFLCFRNSVYSFFGKDVYL